MHDEGPRASAGLFAPKFFPTKEKTAARTVL